MVLIMFWWDRAGTYIWSKPVMKGTHPSPQDSHSSTAVGSKLYVFGGTDGTSPLDDLFVLDTATNTWGKPDVFGDVPAPREGHSASLIGDNLFVFGGCGKSSDPSEEEYYNDLHVLNTNTFVWKKISTTGVSPIPRDIHTCSSYKNCCIVMGGENGGNAYLYDWTQKQWHGGR
ncbi:rab9 effector protein with kelch motifs [Selaginella moellendorffii]|nr:rab9 effector protein with kelch motifs [Selaginella moellendorffii]|eukprot:XP_024523078.1 rab9 effector protein with kelch motifs [Selaginella moellendorffii]